MLFLPTPLSLAADLGTPATDCSLREQTESYTQSHLHPHNRWMSTDTKSMRALEKTHCVFKQRRTAPECWLNPISGAWLLHHTSPCMVSPSMGQDSLINVDKTKPPNTSSRPYSRVAGSIHCSYSPLIYEQLNSVRFSFLFLCS